MALNSPGYEAVLFDLDGTLVDSAPDLAAAVDRMLVELGFAPCGVAPVRDWIGKGIEKLVERALRAALGGGDVPADLRARGLDSFSAAYEQTSGQLGTVYPGVVEAITELALRGVPMACVTNKARRFTVPLLEAIGLAPHFRVLVCGDSVERKKPDPQHVRAACERLGVAAGDTLMVGDSENDLMSASGAGCAVVLVTYGYTEGKPVATLGADRLIDDLREVLPMVRNTVQFAERAATNAREGKPR